MAQPLIPLNFELMLNAQCELHRAAARWVLVTDCAMVACQRHHSPCTAASEMMHKEKLHSQEARFLRQAAWANVPDR